MTLTDEEIRVKVAELMGWRFTPPPIGGASVNDWQRPDGSYTARCPDYLNDPSAALQLCDKMHSEGWDWVIASMPNGVGVRFYRFSKDKPDITAEGPSLARAVALCFLKIHQT